MGSVSAVKWSPARLVAYLAFPLLAGLIQPIAAETATTAGAGAAVSAAAISTPWLAAGDHAATAAAQGFTASRSAAVMTGRWTVLGTERHQGLRQKQVQHSQLMTALHECAVVHTMQGPVRLRHAGANPSSGLQEHASTEGRPDCKIFACTLALVLRWSLILSALLTGAAAYMCATHLCCDCHMQILLLLQSAAAVASTYLLAGQPMAQTGKNSSRSCNGR